MGNRETLGKFVDYFSKPLNNDQLSYLNNFNSVQYEKVELFNDFVLSLTHLIFDTYMGDDVTHTNSDRAAHFSWCWAKNIENFDSEHIYFESTGEHYYYFYNYFNDVYYNNFDKSKQLFLRVAEFWDNTFSVGKNKTKADYDVFIGVYKVLVKQFNKAT